MDKIAALIAAAGFSSRMNAFKPLLPLGSSTVIENTIDSFLCAGVLDITIVVGYNADKLIPVLEQKRVKWVINESFAEGMYSSVAAGVKSLDTNIKGFFFLPADIPLVKSHTIQAIYKAYCDTGKAVIYPVFKGRRGHPPLISSTLFSEILDYDGAGGLKALLSRHKEHAFYVDVEDKGILLDMDTYESYLELCRLRDMRDKGTGTLSLL
ncbi:MAG: nucleotidyltransferase family protein [Bacillota bacterium]